MSRIESIDFSSDPGLQKRMGLYGSDSEIASRETFQIINNAPRIALYSRMADGIKRFADYTGRAGQQIREKQLVLLGGLALIATAAACNGGTDVSASTPEVTRISASVTPLENTVTPVAVMQPESAPTPITQVATESPTPVATPTPEATVEKASPTPTVAATPEFTPTALPPTPSPPTSTPSPQAAPIVVVTPRPTVEAIPSPDSEMIDGVLVTGPADFRERTKEALTLLKSTEWHGFFTGLIKRVEINNLATRYYTGTDKVWVNKNDPFSGDTVGSPTNSPAHIESVKVYACGLVHEARHRYQYLNNPSVFGNLPESELDAYQITKQCLTAVNALQVTLNNYQKRIDCIIARTCPEVWRRQ